MNNKRPGVFNIYLSRVQISDAPFIYKLMNTEDWKHFIGDRGITNIEKAEDYIRTKMLPQFERLGYSNNIIRLDNSNLPVGTIGLFHRKEEDLIPDIGFSILPDYYKKGIGYRAGLQIIEKGFLKYNLPGITAFTTHDNIASQKLIEKLGLRYVGDEALPEDPLPLMKYLLTREEWEKDQAK